MSTESHELVLYATNDSTLYHQRAQAIIKMLAKKVVAGKYNKELAVKAWRHWAEAAARRYGKEFGSSEREGLAMFSTADRNEAARDARDYYDEEVRDAAEKMRGSKKRKNPKPVRGKRARARASTRAGKPGRQKTIEVYYEIWSPEDVEIGDTDNRGHEGDFDVTPDQYDREDGVTAVDKAVKFIRDSAGYVEASSYPHAHKGVWYSSSDYDYDYRTGERKETSYHPKGFTLEEQREIYNALTKRRNPAGKRRKSKKSVRKTSRTKKGNRR